MTEKNQSAEKTCPATVTQAPDGTFSPRPLSRKQVKQDIKKLNLLDDGLFSYSMKGNLEGMTRILQIILDEPDLKLEKTETQETIPGVVGRGVQLDATASDITGRIFNIEVQLDRRGAVVERAAFNGSMIGAFATRPGAEWHEIPQVEVIFVVVADMTDTFGRTCRSSTWTPWPERRARWSRRGCTWFTPTRGRNSVIRQLRAAD